MKEAALITEAEPELHSKGPNSFFNLIQNKMIP